MCFGGGEALESEFQGGWDLILSKLVCYCLSEIVYVIFKCNEKFLFFFVYINLAHPIDCKHALFFDCNGHFFFLYLDVRVHVTTLISSEL